jgi:hypothetical protein
MREHVRLVIAAAVTTVAIAAGWVTPVLAGLTFNGID